MAEQSLADRIALMTGVLQGIAGELGRMGAHVIVHFGQGRTGVQETAAGVRPASGGTQRD